MAGTIVADDLKHSNNDTVGTEYIINGSAKMWANIIASNTPTAKDSLNLSSLTDQANGITTFTYSNAMNNALYAANGTIRRTDDSTTNPYLTGYHLPTTTTVRFTIIDYSGSETDNGYISMNLLGDLA